MTTSDYTVTIAPPGAFCDLCTCDCSGEPCEVTTIDGRERYSHVDLDACLEKREQSPNVITECANCYSPRECFDDGEAYICVDRAACQARAAQEQPS